MSQDDTVLVKAQQATDPVPALKPHAQVPKPKMLNEADFTLTEAAQVFNTVTPPAGTTREDMLRPLFWAHVAKNLRPLTEVRAMPKDGSWYGLYLVLYADRTQAKVKELGFWSLDESAPAPDAEDYEVKWISPPSKWGVIRLADKEKVQDGFPSKDEALKWLAQYVSTVKAVPKA